MAKQDILQLGNPLLLANSSPIEDFKGSQTQSLIADLRDTLASFREATGYGRGIAAPQIGVLQRAIFIRMQPTGFSSALLNPEIIWSGEAKLELWDDCFSFPELMVRVERAAQIKVAYTDELGRRQTVDAEGDLSELLQHEIDHLDGILAVERAISPKAFMTRTEWQRQFKR
jgi:peptide deformylase